MLTAAGALLSRAGAVRRLVPAALACLLAAGCDYPFHPYQDNSEEPFSLYGTLDLKADTQWVRVMPVRQDLLLGPEPLDAVVTLEDVDGGGVVTMNDSVFAYPDPRLEGVAYAHNFWTTARLEPDATYRIRAVRPDGASTTALVAMPHDLQFTFLNDAVDVDPGFAFLNLRAERVLFVEVIHAMRQATGEPGPKYVVRQSPPIPTTDPGHLSATADGTAVSAEGRVDVLREEVRVAAARADWPWLPDLSDLEITLPGTMPSNVEHGVGYVAAVAAWTIPFTRCVELAPRPGFLTACAMEFNGRSASVAGRVLRQPCGDPAVLERIHLTERFADGGAIRLEWKTGWSGEYRFDGLEPGSDLLLEVGADSLRLPAPSPGLRYEVPDVSLPTCGNGT